MGMLWPLSSLVSSNVCTVSRPRSTLALRAVANCALCTRTICKRRNKLRSVCQDYHANATDERQDALLQEARRQRLKQLHASQSAQSSSPHMLPIWRVRDLLLLDTDLQTLEWLELYNPIYCTTPPGEAAILLTKEFGSVVPPEELKPGERPQVTNFPCGSQYIVDKASGAASCPAASTLPCKMRKVLLLTLQRRRDIVSPPCMPRTCDYLCKMFSQDVFTFVHVKCNRIAHLVRACTIRQATPS